MKLIPLIAVLAFSASTALAKPYVDDIPTTTPPLVPTLETTEGGMEESDGKLFGRGGMNGPGNPRCVFCRIK